MTCDNETAQKLLNKWKKILGLSRWGISLEINHTVEEVTDEANKELLGAVLNADGDHARHRAKILLNLFNNDDIEELEDTVCHELIHVIQFPLENLAGCYVKSNRKQKRAENIAEKTVILLTKALIKLEKKRKKK